MDIIVAFMAGAAAGAVAYHRFCDGKYRSAELACNEKDKDRQLYAQLERLMAYGGKEC
ncbi:MAG: hypothetical protein IKA10_03640 [Oscillospiraceae bacterium]|nr:hypothetical protein [Oscillospiraceae bacterium]